MKKLTVALAPVVGFMLVPVSYNAWGSGYGPGMMGGNWSGGYGPGMMGWGIGGFLGPVVMGLFWILVIMGIVYAVRYFTGPPRGTQEESPLDIAKKRYAKGEISKEEFEKLKEDLRKM